MQSVSPVYGQDEVQFEKVIALDQPEYSPLIIVPIDLHIPPEHCLGKTSRSSSHNTG
jgi:hypothetical protein